VIADKSNIVVVCDLYPCFAKVLYTTRGRVAHKRGQAVNAVGNHRAIGFYLGDDCLSDMKTFMSHVPNALDEIQREGLQINGCHINIMFWLGGDLKFITAMLGLAGNSTIHPCPFCLVSDSNNKSQLHFTREQLLQARVEDRTIDMISRHAHCYDGADYDCLLCKNVKKKIKSVSVTSDSASLVFDNDRQRREWQQSHYSVVPQQRPFFHFIPISRIVTDILHIELRIVPVLWKYTVIANCRDASHVADICQWVFDTQRVIISKDTVVQNSRGVVNTIGTESWPGRTCRRILIIHEDCLREVYGSNTNAGIYYEVWQEFINFLHELKYGCPIDTPEYWPGYADRLKFKAEKFLHKFQQIAGASGFTPYMHALLSHVPEIARVFGSLAKGCSQGAEALHQRIHKTTSTSNRREDTLGAQVLTREVMTTLSLDQRNIKLRGGGVPIDESTEHVHGGYMSRKERTEYEDMMTKACLACSQRLQVQSRP